MKTPTFQEDETQRKWWLVDATGQVLGRLASHIAFKLSGKDKPIFAPHQDHGDYIVVVNAEKIKITGNKAGVKTYFSHSAYPGGSQSVPYKTMMEKKPAEVVKMAVKGMIKNKSPLGRRIIKKLFVYAGSAHPHEAQKPQPLQWR